MTAVPSLPFRLSGRLTPAQSFLLLLAVYVLAFAGSWGRLIAFWWQSSTYSYAFLLLPVAVASGYLRWRQYQGLLAGPRYPVLLLVAALILVWWMARVANVRVVEYLATVGMLPAVWLYFWGWPLTRRLLFPFILLLFTVPFWDLLLNLPLQSIAAHGTSFLLDLVGVPNYREGLSIVLPAGRFDVEESCSGLNFLLVSFALSTLYAGYMYRRDVTRIVYIAVFALASVLGNILRVFAITLLGHFTHMQHPLVRNHDIIGWLIFALIAVAMFYFGRRWADVQDAPVPASGSRAHRPWPGVWRVVAPAAVLLAAAPLLLLLVQRVDGRVQTTPALPTPPAGIVGPRESWDSWQPVYHGASREWRVRYRLGDERIEAYFAWYARQRQGAELVHHDNRIVDGERWTEVLAAPSRQYHDGHGVEEYLVRGPAGEERLVWHWYVVGGRATPSPRLAKFYEVVDILFAHRGALTVVVAVPVRKDPETARRTLEDFFRRFPALYNFGTREQESPPVAG